MPTSTVPPDAPVEGRRRWSTGRTLAVVAAVAVLGMWAYVLVYHLSGRWREDTPGLIADPAFAEQAEEVCATALAEVDQLPPAFSAASAAERADTLRASNLVLGDMLTDLEALAPLAGQDQPVVDEWLADWRTYVADRASFADRLTDDPEARFYVTQRETDQRQITVAIDRLAKVNGMESCMSLNDVG